MVSLLFEILGFPNIYISARAHSPAAKWLINFCSKRVPTIHWQPFRFLIVFLSNGKLAKHRKIGQSQQITRFIAMHMQIHKYTNTQIHKYANTQIKSAKRTQHVLYFFEKHDIPGYQIWHSCVSNVKYTNTQIHKYKLHQNHYNWVWSQIWATPHLTPYLRPLCQP